MDLSVKIDGAVLRHGVGGKFVNLAHFFDLLRLRKTKEIHLGQLVQNAIMWNRIPKGKMVPGSLAVLCCFYVLSLFYAHFKFRPVIKGILGSTNTRKLYEHSGLVSQRNENNKDIFQRELELALQGHISTTKHYERPNACEWPPVGLYGRQKLNKTMYSLNKLQEMYFFIKSGHYIPSCIPYQKVAIVVPYRDRADQLKVFFNNVLPRIIRQKQEFVIFIVEQSDKNPFNRGMLANIGYQNAVVDHTFDCIVIHDVDMLPEDDRNLYFCSNKSVNHIAGKMERFKYGLPYNRFAGGIASLSMQQYKNINGFSNQFWGWGGEDDDFMNRITSAGYKMTRPLLNYSHCGDVKHTKAKPNTERYKLLTKLQKTWKVEGLSTLKYELVKKEERDLFVWLLVNLQM